jgi:hypothetical protein
LLVGYRVNDGGICTAIKPKRTTPGFRPGDSQLTKSVLISAQPYSMILPSAERMTLIPDA